MNHKETVLYRKDKFSVHIWAPIGGTFFRSVNIIYAETISQWETIPVPDGALWKIDDNTKEEIINKIMKGQARVKS